MTRAGIKNHKDARIAGVESACMTPSTGSSSFFADSKYADSSVWLNRFVVSDAGVEFSGTDLPSCEGVSVV